MERRNQETRRKTGALLINIYRSRLGSTHIYTHTQSEYTNVRNFYIYMYINHTHAHSLSLHPRW